MMERLVVLLPFVKQHIFNQSVCLLSMENTSPINGYSVNAVKARVHGPKRKSIMSKNDPILSVDVECTECGRLMALSNAFKYKHRLLCPVCSPTLEEIFLDHESPNHEI